MRTSVSTAESSMPRNTVDSVRPKALKAGAASQSQSIALTEVVKDALLRHYGSLKSAALSMTPPMDQGQMTRELQTGSFNLEKLQRLDLDGQAFIAEALYEARGSADPKAKALRAIREARRQLDELAEAIAS